MACMYGKCKATVHFLVRNDRGATVAELCDHHFHETWRAAPHPGLHVNNTDGERVWPPATEYELEELDSKESEGGMKHDGITDAGSAKPDAPRDQSGDRGAGVIPDSPGVAEGRPSADGAIARWSAPDKTPVSGTPTGEGDLYALGRALAQSGYFPDVKSISQAVVKILAGREIGIGPVAAQKGIYIINGTPTYSAGVMASVIQRSGRWSYVVTRLDNSACILEFRDGGRCERYSEFSMEDAEQAGLLDGKNAHSWRHYPRNMLFARAMANGARWYCPGAFGGVTPYTPEELGEVQPPIKPGREPDPEIDSPYHKTEDYKDAAHAHIEDICREKDVDPRGNDL